MQAKPTPIPGHFNHRVTSLNYDLVLGLYQLQSRDYQVVTSTIHYLAIFNYILWMLEVMMSKAKHFRTYQIQLYRCTTQYIYFKPVTNLAVHSYPVKISIKIGV